MITQCVGGLCVCNRSEAPIFLHAAAELPVHLDLFRHEIVNCEPNQAVTAKVELVDF